MYRDGISFSWENGKELSSITNGDNQYSYEYNSQGIRISKTVNGVKHTYTLQGSKILSETYGNITMLYIYDENDLPIGISYRESSYQENEFDSYMLVRNMQGDVIGICNGDGELVAEYTYNAWGECTVTTYTEDNIGNINPFRYRSYYQDSETGFYYLNSRYYDPKIKRFINADDISYMEPLSLKGINLYAYCDNNPVMYVDEGGNQKTSSSKRNRSSNFTVEAILYTAPLFENGFPIGQKTKNTSHTFLYHGLNVTQVIDATIGVDVTLSLLRSTYEFNDDFSITTDILKLEFGINGKEATMGFYLGSINFRFEFELFGHKMAVSLEANIGIGAELNYGSSVGGGATFGVGLNVGVEF